MSLAAVGQWIRSLGQLDPDIAFGEGRPLPGRTFPQAPEVAELAAHMKQAQGDKPYEGPLSDMTAIRHAAILSKTPVREEGSALSLDAHLPRWLPRS